MLYPPDPNGAKVWELRIGDWSKRVGRSGHVRGSGKDTRMRFSGQARFGIKVLESSGDGIRDQGKALEQGQMESPKDWKNFEEVGYVKVAKAASSSSDTDITWYGRGGRHTGDMDNKRSDTRGCMGSAYKGSIYYRGGRVRFGKKYGMRTISI